MLVEEHGSQITDSATVSQEPVKNQFPSDLRISLAVNPRFPCFEGNGFGFGIENSVEHGGCGHGNSFGECFESTQQSPVLISRGEAGNSQFAEGQ